MNKVNPQSSDVSPYPAVRLRVTKAVANAVLAAIVTIGALIAALRMAGDVHVGIRWLSDVLNLSAALQAFSGTLSLLAAALLVALTAGAIFATLGARTAAPLDERSADAVAVILRCLPFFVVALLAEVLAAMNGLWDGPNHDAGTFIAPVVLAIFIVAPITKLIRDSFAVKAPRELVVRRIVSRLLLCLARRLPDLIAADFITKILFSWSGDGRLFFNALRDSQMRVAASCILLMAWAVLAFRMVVACTGAEWRDDADG